jgi:hypothetical protein
VPSRIGLSCAACHYSLDVDWDGKADLRSAQPGVQTPGTHFKPQDAWAIGNQDLHLGWVLTLSANPLLTFTVYSGLVGRNGPKNALHFGRWVRDNYTRAPEAVMREVVLGYLAQPRGSADDTPDLLHDPMQLPLLFTHHNWPYNIDGVFADPTDRNNGVWTAALEFTGLIGLSSDRAGKITKLLFWTDKSVYSSLTANRLADIWTRYSPAVLHDPNSQPYWMGDILGTTDGAPGLLDTDSIYVMQGVPEAVPEDVMQLAKERGIAREASDFGGSADKRGPIMALLGTRVRTPPEIRNQPVVKGILERYPQIDADELVTNAVSLMLDWIVPPRNNSPLLQGQQALVDQGYEVFQASGCADCHRGPFFTDNVIHPLADVGTNPERAKATSGLQFALTPAYDPATGEVVSGGVGSFFAGLFGVKDVGYKTSTLRYVWGSAPYLHDGSIGVALKPGTAPAGGSLKALLSRPTTDKIYGMGEILRRYEEAPESYLRANAALSLQALVLQGERNRVIAENRKRLVPVPQAGPWNGTPTNLPPTELVSMHELGVYGTGHEFWVNDVPGGNKVTALVAFLLALDDCPPRHGSTPNACASN